MIRSPGDPAKEFVDDPCVLNVYSPVFFLVLAHGREHNPVTIHRLGYRSLVIYFSALTLPCQAGITHFFHSGSSDRTL